MVVLTNESRPLVLHVRDANIWGSPERLILGQLQHLTGFRGTVVTYRRRGKSNPLYEELARKGQDCIELDEFGPGDPRTANALATLIRERRPSLIITHDFKSNLYGYLAGRKTKIRHLVHFHGVTAEGLKVRLYNAIDRWVMRRCEAILTVAEATRERLISMGVDGEKVRVVINAVGPEAFEAVTATRISDDDNRPIIIAAGRLSHEKGMDILVEAARLLRERGRSFRVDIFGDGPDRDALSRMIREYDLRETVRLAGFERDLRGYYAGAAFLVIPSRSEAFPLVVLEAWAQGLPVVATPVGRLPELIVSDHTGLVASEVSSEALAAEMAAALDTPDFRTRCGVRGRERAASEFSFEAQAAVLEEIYRDLIGGERNE